MTSVRPAWFERPQREISTAFDAGRLAHGLLLHEDRGAGGLEFARWIAQFVNCSERARAPCGQCQQCRWIAADQHPDVLRLSPEEDSLQIKIEAVRALIAELALTAHGRGYKVAILVPAHALTDAAANALLKTLEEPPGHSLFILVTSRLHALPITIRSRCQALRFTTPARTQVEAALILKRELPPDDARFLAVFVDGRIGEALTVNVADVRARQRDCLTLVKPESLTSNATILSASESLSKTDRGEETLAWLAQWIRDLVIVMVGGDQDQILHLDQLTDLRRYAQRADVDTLLDLLNDIERTEQQATRHLNVQMALETTFLRLREALGLVPAGASA